jgi:thioredoxin 1
MKNATLEMTKSSVKDIVDNNEIVFVDFWASWCGPCKMFGPIFEAAATRHTDVAFAKVDTEAQQELAAEFGIRSIPTLGIFRDGVLLFLQPGMVPAESLDDLVGQVKGLDMDEVRKEIKEKAA